jgi:hypothetical protein
LAQTFKFDTLSTAKKRKKIRAGLFAAIFLPENAEALYVKLLVEFASTAVTASSLIVSMDAEALETTVALSSSVDDRTDEPLKIIPEPVGRNHKVRQSAHLKLTADMTGWRKLRYLNVVADGTSLKDSASSARTLRIRGVQCTA